MLGFQFQTGRLPVDPAADYLFDMKMRKGIMD
jgi:hypothetical protein